MSEVPTFARTPFRETLLGLEYTERADRAVDLFSQACVEQYDITMTGYGYLFAQVFEPDVLREVALLEGQSYESLRDLTHRPTATMDELAGLVQNVAELSVVAAVNLAAALISISRFDPAASVLEHAAAHCGDARDRFEVAMLQFVISNRRDDGRRSHGPFARMRQAIDSGALPPDRVLDACAQAVVWFIKRKELSQEDYDWYVATGTALAETSTRVGPGSISSWYRGLAMVPAAKGDAATTRRFMRYAQAAAQETFTRRPRAYEMHFMKTYHESSVKEHMYVTRDLDAAEQAGHALIALDPTWAPSYGELADAYRMFGRLDQAAQLYETAVEAGPPYLGNHLLAAAQARAKLGDDERALAHYDVLARLAPDSVPTLQAALQTARRISHDSAPAFERALKGLATGAPSEARAENETR